MFEPAEKYLLRSKEERQAHLNLSEACIEIGGDSQEFRGLLAHYLRVTIPKRKPLCHACHNAKCSNPRHLYWGNASENGFDRYQSGQVNLNKGKKRTAEQRKKLSIALSGKLKGRTLSAEHCKNVSIAIKEKMKDPVYRKKLSDAAKARCLSSTGRARPS